MVIVGAQGHEILSVAAGAAMVLSFDDSVDVVIRMIVNIVVCQDNVIPPFLASIKNRNFLSYSNCLGGTPPIAECGRIFL